jgi:hypothetical protein
MEKKSAGKTFVEVIAWLFFATGVFNILGAVFQADGASIGLGIFNTVIGYFFIRERLNQIFKRSK